ncbi:MULTISPECIES: PP2C family serine/threonine-protein phosphatase [unclassified Streptomyces]|uniref:PP2C family serine/threonine-protein phosphatase n=1 Tax=unclassified Streptomyces TaxID=2593676 RepID=UPI0008859A4F|nr:MULTISPECIES: PP2C family serine/threonine-protein phosphatase [unclassified Streptomyces]PBC82446.1 serine/threonine protein phosphatase PrpC [Streptomyces sp. 2321.6]SDR49614.1 Serine/threonine protein phosphatase PrpC [Streptomyces sp. KS_16]SEC58176.1 Serine/threonine protein phosphatase PrpC [Streptomyces sp. 2133.1]SNC68420.1 Serine/threonine protein phosphatase PrpC [Streptomyces sp. 2114.4]
MGVTEPSRCPGCDEPCAAGDNFCGRCGAALPAPAAPPAYGARPAHGAGAVPPVPPLPPAPPGPAAAYGAVPAGPPPPPDPQARLPYGDAGTAPVPAPSPSPSPVPVPVPGNAPPLPGHAPSVAGPGPVAGPAPVADPPPPVGPPVDPPAVPPVDPRVAGYEAGADAAGADAAGTEPVTAAAERGAPGPASRTPKAAPAPPVAPATAPTATPADVPAGGPAPVGAPSGTPAHGAPAHGTARCAACRSGAVGPDGYCEHCGHARPRERDHMERELAGIAAVSDRGHRHHRNEDFFALRAAALPDGTPAVVAVVCDGVSSATRPDEASTAASEAAGEALRTSLPRGTHPQQAMHEAILAASSAVDALAPDSSSAHDEHRQQNAPACTFVGAVVGGGLLTVGWVGDSRAYWIPNDRTAPPARLTEDDSWAAQMVANNLMSEAEANADERAHAITGWLGADAYEVEPHTVTFQPDGPGVVVVCTDGLWNYAESAEQMAAVLPYDAPSRPLESARTLVTHALDGGGHDNVTVALVPFPAPAGRAGSA